MFFSHFYLKLTILTRENKKSKNLHSVGSSFSNLIRINKFKYFNEPDWWTSIIWSKFLYSLGWCCIKIQESNPPNDIIQIILLILCNDWNFTSFMKDRLCFKRTFYILIKHKGPKQS